MEKYSLSNFSASSSDFASEMDQLPPLLQKLLFLRGIKTKDLADNFLNPDYENHLHDPYLMADMEIAVGRILKAIETKEKIIIYSDYDADGIPGAVILHDFFNILGHKNFENYIPDRHNEGFGLNSKAIEGFSKNGVGLIITIDCGIANLEQVALAQSLGMDVIVTDHHEPNGKLPASFAVINPKHPKSNYPFTMICGAAVVYKLVQAVILGNKKTFEWKDGQEKWLLDMAGLATLSDMVPLIDENRAFAFYGLAVLRKSRRLGLVRLLRKLGINQRYLSEDDVTFMITPRINAASRIGDPWDAFHLLSTKEHARADELSLHLNKINDVRKGIVAALAKEIYERISEDSAGQFDKIIIMGNPEWRPSLLGLVAGNLVEKFHRPVLLWGRDGEKIIKGSWRSDGSLDLIALLNTIPEEFLEFGGHKVAGGFSVSPDKIHSLPEAVLKAYEKLSREITLEKVKTVIDSKLSPEEINWQTFGNIEKLSPFGVGNPKPLFLMEDFEIKSVRDFGKQKKHLEIIFTDPKLKDIKAINFFIDEERMNILKPGETVDIVASLEKSFFRGIKSLRLRIQDVFTSYKKSNENE